MSLILIIGLSAVLFILSYLFIKLGERDGTHFVLQLLILGFIMGVLLLVSKATIDANCEMKLDETKTVTIVLDRMAFSFFDVKTNKWVAEKGEFEILIGASTKDIRLKSRFELKYN